MDQVEQYNPPPNPAKLTDSRSTAYIELHGDESWELDALEPSVIDRLIRDQLDTLVDPDQWRRDDDRVERERSVMAAISRSWEEVVEQFGSDS